MNYQNYDEYMQSVLGCSPQYQNNYTYQEPEDMFYLGGFPEDVIEDQDITIFYPEIYKIIYPMVCKACNTNLGRKLTNEFIEQITDEIYNNIEPRDNVFKTGTPLKNGDVINPNSKDPEPVSKETRHSNCLLRDLIKILLLKEWEKPKRPPYRPPMQPPPRPGNNRPPMPPLRPRYY